VLGAGATIATRAQPGQVLGGCIAVGTVAAALAVRPRAGRVIFPVPALSYLIAALVAGIVYNRSTSKTELVIGATQWIADGFFLMALATVLAIVVITARWYLGSRGGRGYAAPGPPRPQQGPLPQGSAGPDQRSGPYPGQFSGGQHHGPYPDQRDGRRADQRDVRPADQRDVRPADQRPGRPPDRRPGSGPYDQQPGSGRYDRQPGSGRYDRQPGSGRYDRQPGSGRYDRQPGSGPYNFSSGA
jgi:hypothetical protein